MKFQRYLSVGLVIILFSLTLVFACGQKSSAKHLKGHGNSVTSTFHLEKGATIFEFSHEGETDFIVRLLNESTGEQVDTIVNQTGVFDGEVMREVPADGDYLLNITTKGDWEADISQPSLAGAHISPVSLSGKGYEVTEPVSLSAGVEIFTFQHHGEGDFVVQLRDGHGSIEKVLVKETGKYKGGKNVTVSFDGPYPSPLSYYISVKADGRWQIGINE